MLLAGVFQRDDLLVFQVKDAGCVNSCRGTEADAHSVARFRADPKLRRVCSSCPAPALSRAISSRAQVFTLARADENALWPMGYAHGPQGLVSISYRAGKASRQIASTGTYCGHHWAARTDSTGSVGLDCDSPCSCAVRMTCTATTLEVMRRSAFEGRSEAPGASAGA